MNLKITSVTDNAIQVQIEKEDYSVADIIHKELLNVKHVKFAGVPPPHPLIKTLTIQLHTDGSQPNKALKEAIALAQERVSELLKVANQVFPRAPKPIQPAEVQAEQPQTESSVSTDTSPSA